MREILGLKVKFGSFGVFGHGGVKMHVFSRYLATVTSGKKTQTGKVLDINEIHILITAKAISEFPIVRYLGLTVLVKITQLRL